MKNSALRHPPNPLHKTVGQPYGQLRSTQRTVLSGITAYLKFQNLSY